MSDGAESDKKKKGTECTHAKPSIANAKFEVEKFDGTNNFAKDTWKKLEDQYMIKSVENRFHLKRRLFRFNYRQGISMSEHISDFNKILADLVNLDVQINDEDKALCLLNSLPDEYEHLITTLLSHPDPYIFYLIY
ncbi:hypothetical protein ACLB2K_038269 [Fragaria x ananassa]